METLCTLSKCLCGHIPVTLVNIVTGSTVTLPHEIPNTRGASPIKRSDHILDVVAGLVGTLSHSSHAPNAQVPERDLTPLDVVTGSNGTLSHTSHAPNAQVPEKGI